jgi:hypothetical protein
MLVMSGAEALYQLEIYDKSEENMNKLMNSLGLIPDQNRSSRHLIPGVSCGKQTPLITEYL